MRLRKPLKRCSLVLLAAILLFVCLFLGITAAEALVRGEEMGARTRVLPQAAETGVFQLQMPTGVPLRLAVFTDLHFDGYAPLGTLRAKLRLRVNVRALRPDLLAVLGDTALCPYNKGRTRAFVRLMDSFGLPWTAVLGNHEGEGPRDVPRRDVVALYKQSPRYLGNVELPGVTGYGNQAIAVLDADGAPAQMLYFLDSGGGKTGHDYIQQDQLDWLARAAGEYPGVPGMIFLHIPTWQYKDAYEALETGGAALLRGDLREAVCTAGAREQSDALVALAKELGVWAFVCGHDHANNFDISCQGMRYIYAQSGGYSLLCYDQRSKGVQGCTVFVIHPDGSVDVEQNFN